MNISGVISVQSLCVLHFAFHFMTRCVCTVYMIKEKWQNDESFIAVAIKKQNTQLGNKLTKANVNKNDEKIK